MRIKIPPIDIPEDNPFAEDQLDRKQSAEVLTQFISTIREPFVLAIDSPWGTGKTTFINMWLRSLKKEGVPCLYFNAWENDFTDDPLVSFIGEMKACLDTVGEASQAKVYYENAKKLGASIVKRAIPVTIKIVTAGVVNLEELSEEALADFDSGLAKEKIDRYEADKSTIKDFKKELSKFVQQITKKEGDENKPLVFFIDELDRCRPTYAVELLERLKHLFNIEGIVFVLALDKEQIGHSLRSIYGNGMNVDGYLRRFIDVDYRLPETPTEGFCNLLFTKFGFPSYFGNRSVRDARYEKDQLIKTFSRLATIFGFSLRKQEQCFSQLSVVLRTTLPNDNLYPLFLSFLIAFKAANPKLYIAFTTGKTTAEDVLNYIKETKGGTELLEDNYGRALEAYIVSSRASYDEMQELVSKYTPKLIPPNQQEERPRRIRELLQSFLHEDTYGILDYLVKKIEISDQFKA
ncbi:MAG: hypothetical protein HW415_267 [Deltaproteobacteria bacterium]|nr:hypothetical protein [Deltaproteobacteria bacterium]